MVFLPSSRRYMTSSMKTLLWCCSGLFLDSSPIAVYYAHLGTASTPADGWSSSWVPVLGLSLWLSRDPPAAGGISTRRPWQVKANRRLAGLKKKLLSFTINENG